MANELDEVRGPISEEGRDVNVIQKQVPVKVGFGSKLLCVGLWFLGVIPGLIFFIMRLKARNYLQQLQQKLQHNASQIDNYMEQRVQILQNVAGIVQQSVALDKDTMTTVAAYRGGVNLNDENRSEVAGNVDRAMRSINVAFEAYPELKAHSALKDAMQQNSYLQREITAARELYNDTVLEWNQVIFEWPTKMIAAAKAGYTTRIPFTASRETKEAARSKFF